MDDDLDPGTIESDDEVAEEEEEEVDEQDDEEAAGFFGGSSEFSLGGSVDMEEDGDTGADPTGWNLQSAISLLTQQGAKTYKPYLSAEDIAAQRQRGGGAEDQTEATAEMEEDQVRDMVVTDAERSNAERSQRKRLREDQKKQADAVEEPVSKSVDDDALAKDYFDGSGDFSLPGSADGSVRFSQLNLSRPLMRGVQAMGFVEPTAIQARVIPVALAGRDVCASAVTGSGKTAAFLLPSMERLLYRPKAVAATRVLVVTPTRELAAQCHAMGSSLAQFTDMTLSLITGGTKNLRPQEAELRSNPDIVICTPGRLIDHLRNSAGVHLDGLEILILDEVDRLLELGFREEVEELVRLCPTARQTLLFSATMSTTVEALAALSLHRPVRVGVDVHNAVASRLVQEFVRIRQGREGDRKAILMALVTRTFKERVIVFFDTKVQAHRMALAMGLLGVRCAELHGNLTQIQRLEALNAFRNQDVDVLVATDLAARGLDVPQVETVINFEMPRKAETYIHRVGRTARAGCGGRSVTLIGESRRLVMKEVLRNMAPDQREGIKTRALTAPVVAHFRSLSDSKESDLEALLEQEQQTKELRVAQMQLDKAENSILHEDEIAARPARTWFQSEADKSALKERSTANAKDEAEQVSRDSKALATTTTEKTITGQTAPGERLRQMMKSEKLGQGAGGGKIDKTHRLSRKKRRRLEVMAALEEDAAEPDARRVDTEGLNSLAKRRQTKRSEKESQQHKMEEDDDSDDMDHGRNGYDDYDGDDGEYGEDEEGGPKSRKKTRRNAVVVENGGSFNDDDDGGDGDGDRGKKSTKGAKEIAGPFGFTEFDPTRVRLRKKKNAPRAGNFKSKGKYKRR